MDEIKREAPSIVTTKEIQATATTPTGNVQGKLIIYPDGKFDMVDSEGKKLDIEKMRRVNLEQNPEGVCPVCNKTFIKKRADQIYDGVKCRNLYNLHKHRNSILK